MRAHLDERINECSDYILKSQEELYEYINGKNFHIEIGCGKGGFIVETAKQNPDICHIAVEHIPNVAILAAEKAKGENLENLRFVFKNVMDLSEDIKDGTVKRIYLNFSDPWRKNKQAKRRLTHPGFLKVYKRWLSEDGEIFLKTDNEKLFEFSLNSFCSEDFHLKNITFDLHNSSFEGNIMTEYEKKFYDEGKNIFRLEARK
ncbi:MAG: tRNA (guanosine(46)-N7)-methyltransferase TrmB [Bacillota bacterium]|nr:tRNA (guanosine(46)-N7)-methyltransferase TrmB [Bacillota bacterium]